MSERLEFGVLVKRCLLVTVMAIGGAIICGGAARILFLFRTTRTYPEFAQRVMLPHQIPKDRNGLSFRFAMVHDVVHGRFTRHGADHYRERNQIAQESLNALSDDDPNRWPHADDLAAGLDRLDDSTAAVTTMREKLRQQEQREIAGRELYTTFANLGTFLIHSSIPGAMRGDTEALERFSEGLDFVRKAVDVNPVAHFGREKWQVAIAKFLLASVEDPDLLRQFDFLGNRLDLTLEELKSNNMFEGPFYGSAVNTTTYFEALRDIDREAPRFFDPGFDPADEEYWTDIESLRDHVTFIGAEDGWNDVNVACHRAPVAFDEPMLGIIGMWRQGGGANPHFSLAIAETMLRTGQRFIAWTAYARTGRMADRYSSDPELRQFLIDHCSARREQIESTLDAEVVETLQSQFDAELEFGQATQAEYQDYEAHQIEAGIPLNDDDFHDGFETGRPRLATTSGSEEWYSYVRPTVMRNYQRRLIDAVTIFGAGCGAMLALLIVFLSRPSADSTGNVS